MKEWLEELKIKEEDIKRIKKIARKKTKKVEKEKKVNWFVKTANLIFKNFSLKISNKKFFQTYKFELRKADIPLILSSYLSLIFFLTLLTFIFSITLSLFLSFKTENFLFSFLRNFSFSILFTVLIFLMLLAYPKIKIKSEERKIEAELPFAALYMASIASAGVQPIKVLDLLANSKEYRAIAKQIRKVTNQVNLFGVDIVTAIKSANKAIASKSLVEMLNGLAMNITTGGDLKAYLEEEAKRFLTDYKVKREKFTASASVYADIYTGLLIAAPLIFMLVLLLINLFQGTIAGISPSTIGIFGIFGLILINIIFLIYLQIVTPPI